MARNNFRIIAPDGIRLKPFGFLEKTVLISIMVKRFNASSIVYSAHKNELLSKNAEQLQSRTDKQMNGE